MVPSTGFHVSRIFTLLERLVAGVVRTCPPILPSLAPIYQGCIPISISPDGCRRLSRPYVEGRPRQQLCRGYHPIYSIIGDTVTEFFKVFKVCGWRVNPAIARLGNLSLRWRLVLLVIASIVPLMAFSFDREYLRYRENVDAVEERTLTIAGGMSLLIEDKLQTQIATLETLAEGRRLATGDLDAFRVRAETTAARLFPGGAIELLTEDGREVVNTRLPAGAPVQVRANLESMRQVFATGQPVVSDVVVDSAGSRPVVAVDVPVRAADGTIAYVLSAHPRLEEFADPIRLRHFPASWLITVFDRRGAVVARVPDGDRYAGQQAPPWLLSRLAAKRAGFSDGTSLEGIPVLAAFSQMKR